MRLWILLVVDEDGVKAMTRSVAVVAAAREYLGAGSREVTCMSKGGVWPWAARRMARR